jgi:hypothetical protein
MSPWILKDFRAPVRVLPRIQDGYNRKGLVSEEGERKLAFDVLRTFYDELRGEPDPAGRGSSGGGDDRPGDRTGRPNGTTERGVPEAGRASGTPRRRVTPR